jgi:4,5-DOPA dioxygenase extradiol
MAAWDKLDDQAFGFEWALTINEKFKQLITSGDFKPLINYESFGTKGRLAIPTPEHYLPLLYTLGLKSVQDEVSFFNDRTVAGSLSMTSVKLG